MEKDLMLFPLKHSLNYNQVIKALKSNQSPILINGLTDGQKSHMTYAIQREKAKHICIITYNEIQARNIYQDLKFYLGEEIIFFSSKDILFYDTDATSEETREIRIQALEKLSKAEGLITVTSAEALLPKLPPANLFKKQQLDFELGKNIELEGTIANLITQGYERVDRVEGKGHFSIRGGIIDIFPTSQDTPIRIELFDEEIDSIRKFHVESQKSMQKIDKISVYPRAENITKQENITNSIQQIRQDLKNITKKLSDELVQKLETKTNQMIEQLENIKSIKGIERFFSYFYNDADSLIQYLPKDAIIILDEPHRIREGAESYEKEFKEKFKSLLEGGEVLPKQGELIFSHHDIFRQMKKHHIIAMSLLPKAHRELQPMQIVNFATRTVLTFNGKIDLLIKEIKTLQYKGYKTILLPGTKERALKLLEALRENSIQTEYIVTQRPQISTSEVLIIDGSLSHGFEYVEDKFIIITDYEIYGVHKKKKHRLKRNDARAIKSYIELSVGDYVVHEAHGIGKYVGIKELKVEGITKDYLKIQYAGEDTLYVPTDQMDLIQKYIGSDDKSPKIHKLGGTDWSKTKKKVQKEIENMAKELLEIYAKRQKSKGYAFQKDTDWQKQFEDLFPYQETPDQIKCIQEMKNDMESQRSMERLLCGDVGYGKTEVAIRGAFKAVMDSKQVAFLVPTTILAQQHYNNFKQRFTGFPIKVEMLSRFKTAAQQKQILSALRQGNIDIIIGTHRMISKDVEFKDLGLLIIDEEQRFGVKHKETLKKLKENIDVITLTATPIPRTLHMSMIGIRDMSVIEDPPEERLPVQTYVIAHNEAVIADAIIRELARGGQVYYVHNRVEGINQIAAKLLRMVPQARIAVGHGQMREKELERLMFEYYNGEYDVLVCTTIIETGLDISNVNTIIIQDADKLGLSQLYQLRGRVGRSNRQGYAYLMYEKNKILSEIAEKRLKAIKEFTEFGSGFKIAMRDLEIRGAGNLLGAEQHGHMAAIGYDLYVKLLEETVGALKGQYKEKYEDTSIDFNVDAYIPEKYISNHSDKIEIYKKIASIRHLQDLYEVEEEVEDRFGDIPISVRNLLMISYIKALGRKLKIKEILQKDKQIKISFNENSVLNPQKIAEVLYKYKWKLSFHGNKQPYFIYKIIGIDQNINKIHEKMLSELKDILNILIDLQKDENKV